MVVRLHTPGRNPVRSPPIANDHLRCRRTRSIFLGYLPLPPLVGSRFVPLAHPREGHPCPWRRTPTKVVPRGSVKGEEKCLSLLWWVRIFLRPGKDLDSVKGASCSTSGPPIDVGVPLPRFTPTPTDSRVPETGEFSTALGATSMPGLRSVEGSLLSSQSRLRTFRDTPGRGWVVGGVV